jgi:predicted nucleic acid-binding protein
MTIIIDTNILISALIRDSLTRAIIVFSGLDFRYPEVSLDEIKKHRRTILKKSGMTGHEFELLLGKILSRVSLLHGYEISPFMRTAKKTMGRIDPNDVVFVAAALACPGSLIWSDDKDFQRQKAVKAATTGQFIRMFFAKD